MRLRTLASLSLMTFSVAGALLGEGARPVDASCIGAQHLPQVLASAPVVFVGRVVSTSNLQRTAVVRVQEVWRGKHVSAKVIVLGSGATGNAITSVDRHFQKGVRYLFVPVPMQRTSPFQDNNCTATQPFTATLIRYRPVGAHRP